MTTRSWPDAAATDSLRRKAAGLWGTAATQALHGPFCSCAAPAVQLDAGTIELDIIDFLDAKYRRERRDGLCAALEARRRDGTENFLSWLVTLGLEGRISQSEFAEILVDVVAILESMTEHAKPTGLRQARI
jgi:hypothetical protein